MMMRPVDVHVDRGDLLIAPRNLKQKTALKQDLLTGVYDSARSAFVLEPDAFVLRTELGRLMDRAWAPHLTADAATWLAVMDARTFGTERRVLDRRLYPFQQEGVAWLRCQRRALLADDPGVGKTCQMLLALSDDQAVIVVSPASAKSVWESETKKWRPDFQARVLERRQMHDFGGTKRVVTILNYDILPEPTYALFGKAFPAGPMIPGTREKIQASIDVVMRKSLPMVSDVTRAQFMKKQGWRIRPFARALPHLDFAKTTLIFDEAHLLKERTSLRHAAAMILSQRVRDAGGRVYGLTATPMPNTPPELFAVLEVLGLEKRVFGPKPFNGFLKDFQAKKKHFGGFTYKAPMPAFYERRDLAILRREKKDVLPQLPPVTFRDIQVPLSRRSSVECDKLEEALRERGVTFESNRRTSEGHAKGQDPS